MTLTGEKTEIFGEHFPESLRLPQISCGLNWDRNRTYAARGSSLTLTLRRDPWAPILTSVTLKYSDFLKIYYRPFWNCLLFPWRNFKQLTNLGVNMNSKYLYCD